MILKRFGSGLIVLVLLTPVNLALHQLLIKLLIDGSVIIDPDLIATKLNDYFCNVGTNLNAALPLSLPTSLHYNQYLPQSLPNSFVCDKFSLSEISNVITRLKERNSAGPDPFNAAFIYEFQFPLLSPLCHIFNLSIETGKFPSLLKIAKTVPIFKKGDRTAVVNYRPISLLSIFCKIFETLVFPYYDISIQVQHTL